MTRILGIDQSLQALRANLLNCFFWALRANLLNCFFWALRANLLNCSFSGTGS
jgi:hypothetical protein